MPRLTKLEQLEQEEQLLKEDLDRINEENDSDMNKALLREQIAVRKATIETLRSAVKEADFNAFKVRLEEESMAKVAALKKESGSLEHKLEELMQSGFNEFEKKVGRPMTYGEMRELYG